jgi:hypothetical protein
MTLQQSCRCLGGLPADLATCSLKPLSEMPSSRVVVRDQRRYSRRRCSNRVSTESASRCVLPGLRSSLTAKREAPPTIHLPKWLDESPVTRVALRGCHRKSAACFTRSSITRCMSSVFVSGRDRLRFGQASCSEGEAIDPDTGFNNLPLRRRKNAVTRPLAGAWGIQRGESPLEWAAK